MREVDQGRREEGGRSIQHAARLPCRWGRWGSADEVGALNFLTADAVITGSRAVTSGRVFTLQLPMFDPAKGVVSPSRTQGFHAMVRDASTYATGEAVPLRGGLKSADDVFAAWTHGTTHCDALGHAWLGEQIWNGYSADTTTGGLERASVLPIADKGIVGPGVLLDLARYRGVPAMASGEEITYADLIECARAQKCELLRRHVLLIRTGWLGYAVRQRSFPDSGERAEPGMTYGRELVRWFRDMEIPSLVTDTTGNELPVDPRTGAEYPLHAALMSRLGVVFTELAWLDDLAADCADDGRYRFFYVAAPLKIARGTGAPVNPVVLK